MACILSIETSTNICSVAVSDKGVCVFEREDRSGTPAHNEKLGTFIDEAIGFCDQHLMDLEAVAVSMGPGSYTGLRIGVSMAKGICYGRNIPLIAIPTLQIVTVPVLLGRELPEDALLVPMLDARRMEVYAAVYDRALKAVRDVQADVVTEETYREWLDRGPVYFLGGGAPKCMDVIAHPNATLIEGMEPLARNMFPLAEKKFLRGEFEDTAYFTPFYLKEFVALKPKKLI